MNRNKKILCVFCAGGLLAALCSGLFIPAQAHAQGEETVDSRETDRVIIYRGDVVSLRVYSLTRLAVTKPGVVEFGKIEGDQLLLIGQREGETPIFIWDEFGKRKLVVHVISEDLDLMIERINNLFLAADIHGLNLRKNMEEKKIVITGKVPTDKEEAYMKVMSPFITHVIDLTTASGELIQIDAQITELTTTLTKTMGMLWSTGSSGELSFAYPETLPDFDGSFGDYFKIGDFERTSAIQATVNMLLAEGKARILSKPSIIVTSGESATFLVGGEIPIRTTTVSEGNVSENISYKAYGVDLTVTPEILADKIDLDLSVSIRDVDASNAVGSDTAFTTRSANTKLLLNDGQTIILAGLIKSNKGEQLTRVPLLSSIPIIGVLFRSKSWTPNKEEEVVISLTSKILKDKDKGTPAAEPFRSARPAAVRQKDKYLLLEEEPDFGSDVYASDEDMLVAMEEQPRDPQPFRASFRQNVPPAGEENPRDGMDITDYAQAVQEKISRSISFPIQARERGWEGVVTLSLDILSDGSLVDVAVEESSGFSILDTDAVNTAQISAPFDPFPRRIDLEEIRLTLPIIYSQEAIIEDIIWR